MARTLVATILVLAALGAGGHWLVGKTDALAWLARTKSPTSLRATTRWLDSRLDAITAADASSNDYEFKRVTDTFSQSTNEMLDWEIAWDLRVAAVAEGVVWLDSVYWNDEGGLFTGGRCLWLLPPGQRTIDLLKADDLFERLYTSHKIGLRIGTDIDESRARSLVAGSTLTIHATIRAHAWAYRPTWVGGPILVLQLALDDLGV